MRQLDFEEDGISWFVTTETNDLMGKVRISTAVDDYFIAISQGDQKVILRPEHVAEFIALLNNAARWRLQKGLDE